MNQMLTEETIKEELVKLAEEEVNEKMGNPLYAAILKKCTICFDNRMPFLSLTRENTDFILYVNTENYQKLSNHGKLCHIKFEITEVALLSLLLSRK